MCKYMQFVCCCHNPRAHMCVQMCETCVTTQGHLCVQMRATRFWIIYRLVHVWMHATYLMSQRKDMSIFKCVKLLWQHKGIYICANTSLAMAPRRQVHVRMRTMCLMMSQRKDIWAYANVWNSCDKIMASMCVQLHEKQRQECVRMTLDKLTMQGHYVHIKKGYN